MATILQKKRPIAAKAKGRFSAGIARLDHEAGDGDDLPVCAANSAPAVWAK
jgi:hypothetical protein